MHCGRPTDSVPAREGPEAPAAALKPARTGDGVVLLAAEFLNQKQEQSRNSGAAAAAAAEPAWNSQLDADQQADCCAGDGGGGGSGEGGGEGGGKGGGGRGGIHVRKVPTQSDT